jgi:hypothetical protein
MSQPPSDPASPMDTRDATETLRAMLAPKRNDV